MHIKYNKIYAFDQWMQFNRMQLIDIFIQILTMPVKSRKNLLTDVT